MGLESKNFATGPALEPLRQIESNRGLSLLQSNNYHFTARRTAVWIGLHELRLLTNIMPLLLCRLPSGWQLVGVMGFLGGENLLVGPAGAWQAHYVPDRLRWHPVTIMRAGDGDICLAKIEPSERLVSGNENMLLDIEGQRTALYQQMLDRFKRHAQLASTLAERAELLLQHGLLRPLSEDNKLLRGEGEFYTADMDALPTTAADVLAKFASSESLAMGFGLYNSVGNLNKFKHYLQMRGRKPVDARIVESLGGSDEVTFNFDQ